MEHFIAIGVTSGDRAEFEAVVDVLCRRGWSVARRTTSAWLLVKGAIEVRDMGGGWVVGALFGRESARPAPPSILPLFKGVEPAFRALLRDFWGRYVAIAPLSRAILRDPSGHLEALTWRLPGGWVVTSTLHPLLGQSVSPPGLALDWKAVGRMLDDPARVSDALGLSGISAVAPGAMQGFDSEPGQTALWEPSHFAHRPHASYEASRDAVLAAVEMSVSAEACGDHRLLVEISGGLDSAIVASMIAGLTPRASCRYVNIFTADCMGDERRFARKVAEYGRVALAEVAKPEIALDPDGLETMPQGARPSTNAIDQHADAVIAEQARIAGATRILTGQGGDIVFFQAPSTAVAGELWGPWLRRPRADPAWRQLEAAARWNRRSTWSLLGEAVRAHSRKADKPEGHPWLAEPMAPAKAEQVRLLARAQAFHGASVRGEQARLVHPLLHQPVLEAVLSAPVIDLVRGGQGRSLARDAFSAKLPTEVAQRTSKGDLTAYYGRMLVRSLPRLMPYLLDGRLTEQGLVDRQALEAALEPDRLIYEGNYPRFFRILAMEAFVRHWERRLG